MDNIAFFAPLGRAWNRMKVALFQPFDLHKWFVVGFTAFLAGLADGNRGSSSSRVSDDWSFREFLGFPGRAWAWLIDHPGWFMLIAFGVFMLILIGIIILWLSSRGKFMFLDNVVHDKAEVANPWKEYKREGDSLFLWRLVFILVCFIFFVSLIVIFFVGASQLYEGSYFDRVPVPFIIMMGLIFLVMIILIGFISTFLDRHQRMGKVPVSFREIPISFYPVWIVDVRIDHHVRDFYCYCRLIDMLHRLPVAGHPLYRNGGDLAGLVLVQGFQH
jgi:hypothetical protein